MAPRTAKSKKNAEPKVADNGITKKGRAKAKAIQEEENDLAEPEVDDKVVASTEKKTKRGKKVLNGTNEAEANNVEIEDSPPPKKSKKKNVVDVEEKKTNGDNSEDNDEVISEDENKIKEEDEIKDDAEEIVEPIKGRKKQPKKDAGVKTKESSRGKKNKQTESNAEKDDTSEEKPKAAKGRTRKGPKANTVHTEADDTAEPEPVATKGRKKAPAKAAKEKTPENDETEDNDKEDDLEPEEPKKKEKVKRNLGKKTQARGENEDQSDEMKEEPAAKKRKNNKKDDKAKGDAKEEEAADLVTSEDKPKGKRGKKAVVETETTEEEPQEGEQSSKRRRKQPEVKASKDEKKKAPAKNKSVTNYEDLNFSNSSVNRNGKEWNLKVSCWNVDGIRAWFGKGGLDFIKYEKPDILCLQEVKCSQEKLPDELISVPGYHAYWLCSDKDGYAGVGLYTTKLAMNVQYGLQNEELDSEGRIITAEYEQFYLITTYVPNAGRKLVSLPKRLQWNEAFRKYVKDLDKKKPVIICGDMNVAHNEIDLANPKTNKKNAGFTNEEREGMTELLGDGFVDTFRHLKPEEKGAYTFWTYMNNSRAKNVGWRLDYFIISERLLPSLCDSVIRDGVYGSDHCPITLFLHLTSANKPK